MGEGYKLYINKEKNLERLVAPNGNTLNLNPLGLVEIISSTLALYRKHKKQALMDFNQIIQGYTSFFYGRECSNMLQEKAYIPENKGLLEKMFHKELLELPYFWFAIELILIEVALDAWLDLDKKADQWQKTLLKDTQQRFQIFSAQRTGKDIRDAIADDTIVQLLIQAEQGLSLEEKQNKEKGMVLKHLIDELFRARTRQVGSEPYIIDGPLQILYSSNKGYLPLVWMEIFWALQYNAQNKTGRIYGRRCKHCGAFFALDKYNKRTTCSNEECEELSKLERLATAENSYRRSKGIKEIPELKEAAKEYQRRKQQERRDRNNILNGNKSVKEIAKLRNMSVAEVRKLLK